MTNNREFHRYMIAYYKRQFDYYYNLQFSIAQPDDPYNRPDIRRWTEPALEAAWTEQVKHERQYNNTLLKMKG